MSFSKGDAVLIEGTRHEGEEGRVLGVDGDEAFIDIFGSPGKTRTVVVSNLADSPWTKNEDWSEDESNGEQSKQDQPPVPGELEQFDENDRVKVVDSNDERFIGATGTVIDAEKINGEWSVMVYLDMPWDRNRDFGVDDLMKTD